MTISDQEKSLALFIHFLIWKKTPLYCDLLNSSDWEFHN